MAGASLLALLDDMATILDDVSILTKVAAKKTAGVLGDDLALNAQQVSGVRAARELPVVWAVAKGSMLNKLILVPAALVISALAPWAIVPLLVAGGLFLCFEGFEKLAHRFLHKPEEEEAHRAALARALVDPSVDLVAVEKSKIKGAVRTDFILSAEIIVITLGVVAQAPLMTRVSVLATVAVLVTVGVYGLVALIVKLDDLGVHLAQREGRESLQAVGRGILVTAPYLMRGLAIVGTAAMFLVGGGILVHSLPALENLLHWVIGDVAGLLATLLTLILHALTGILAGGLVVAAVHTARHVFTPRNGEAS